MGLWAKGTGLLRFARGVRGLRDRQISVDDGVRTVARGVTERAARFLAKLERAVYANPRSPYRRLLAVAGCTLDDVARLVRADGLEGALRKLARAGVHVTFDEL